MHSLVPADTSTAQFFHLRSRHHSRRGEGRNKKKIQKKRKCFLTLYLLEKSEKLFSWSLINKDLKKKENNRHTNMEIKNYMVLKPWAWSGTNSSPRKSTQISYLILSDQLWHDIHTKNIIKTDYIVFMYLETLK